MMLLAAFVAIRDRPELATSRLEGTCLCQHLINYETGSQQRKDEVQ
jgi:hypothetical protein